MSDKIYVNGVFAKARDTQYGEVITLNCKADELMRFIEEHQDNGWIKFDVQRKRTPGEKTTHSVSLNNWKPEHRGGGAVNRPPSRQPQTKFPDVEGGGSPVPF